MGSTLPSVWFLPRELELKEMRRIPEMIGGPQRPSRLIEEILSGWSAVVSSGEEDRERERGRDEKRAGDVRLINNVDAIFIRQEEGSVFSTVAGTPREIGTEISFR